MRRYVLRFVLFSALLCIATTTTRPARSQVPDAVYQDVKGVIEDLLTNEVAHTVVPNLVCLAGRTGVQLDTPGAIALTWHVDGKPDEKRAFTFEATQYFPRTLQLIYSRQFGSLRATLLDEIADLAAHILYRVLVTLPTANTPDALNMFLRAAKLGGQSESQAGLPKAAKPEMRTLTYDLLPDAQFTECAKAVADAFDKQSFTSDGMTELDRECTNDYKNEYACDVAYAFRATAHGKTDDAEEYMVRALAQLVTERLVVVGASSLHGGAELSAREAASASRVRALSDGLCAF